MLAGGLHTSALCAAKQIFGGGNKEVRFIGIVEPSLLGVKLNKLGWMFTVVFGCAYFLGGKFLTLK